jgi:hypothetical protein
MINEKTILVCIKQTIRDFDGMCDIHIVNYSGLEEYTYSSDVFVTQMHYIQERELDNFEKADINFHMYNNLYDDPNHHRNDIWSLIQNNDTNCYKFNDVTLGKNNNMVLNHGHIMLEQGIPICVLLGCKTIIFSGFVGGFEHEEGINVNYGKIEQHHIDNMTLNINLFSKYSKIIADNEDVSFYTLCDTKYEIPKMPLNLMN